ncbi:MAG: DUF4175 family protein [Myxococcaceae bacterium]
MLVPFVTVAVQDAPPIGLALLRTRAWGAGLDVVAATLVGLALGHALGDGPTGVALGVAGGLLLALRWTRWRAALALEAARPALGSALEAYLEGQGARLRPRLEAWVVGRLGWAWLPRSLARAGLAAALALAVLLLPRAGSVEKPPRAASPPPGLALTARLEPPAYTGWPSVEVSLPQVRGLRHSVLLLEVRTSAQRLLWEEKGGQKGEVLPVDGRATLRLPLEKTTSVRLAAEGGPVALLELEAQPDAPPQVTLQAPEADSTVSAAPGRLALRATAQDDVRVTRLGFHWTLAQGHGEGMHFQRGALWGHSALNGQHAEASAQLDPLALGMKAGDTLVVWAEATDGNALDGPGVGRSEARLLRWEEAVVDVSTVTGGGRLPPPPSEASERELLARTQRLLRSGATGASRAAQSAQLADVQRHLREGFGFFLQQENGTGPQLDVDEPEVAESGEVRGRRLLAQAVSEMWTAEAELALGRPSSALAPERAAVKALDAAFGNERLALRPLRPPDKPVDERRRLSGQQGGLRPKAQGHAAPNRPDVAPVEALARRLLLSAEVGLTPEAARALADALWALPADSGIPAASLAAPLYAGGDAASLGAAARAAGVALSHWLRPSPEVVPPASLEEGALVARLPALPPP